MWVPKSYGDLEPAAAPIGRPVELEQLERVVLRPPGPPMIKLAFETALDHLGNLTSSTHIIFRAFSHSFLSHFDGEGGGEAEGEGEGGW
jgi:hypothetical protein